MADLHQTIPNQNALFLGPSLFGAILQAMLQGVLIGMTWSYFVRGKEEPLGVRCVVMLLTLAAIAQTCISFHDVWSLFVSGYGDWHVAFSYRMSERLNTAYSATMTAPVQAYYVWRCFKVMGRNYYLLVSMSTLLVSAWGVAVAATVTDFQTSIVSFPVTRPVLVSANGTVSTALPARSEPLDFLQAWPILPTFIYWLISTALLDVAITCILLVYLLKTKARSSFKGLNTNIQKLLFVLWESAIPPTFLAVTTLIIYLSFLKTKAHTMDIAFGQLLGKLYVISLIMTLNARISINGSRTGNSYEMSRAKNVATTVRIDVHTTQAGDHDQQSNTPTSRFDVNLSQDRESGILGLNSKMDYPGIESDLYGSEDHPKIRGV